MASKQLMHTVQRHYTHDPKSNRSELKAQITEMQRVNKRDIRVFPPWRMRRERPESQRQCCLWLNASRFRDFWTRKKGTMLVKKIKKELLTLSSDHFARRQSKPPMVPPRPGIFVPSAVTFESTYRIVFIVLVNMTDHVPRVTRAFVEEWQIGMFMHRCAHWNARRFRQ